MACASLVAVIVASPIVAGFVAYPTYLCLKKLSPHFIRSCLILLNGAPIFDVVLDCISTVDLFLRGWMRLGGAMLAVLLLSLRFTLLYATLHPKPTLGVVLGLYCPGLLLLIVHCLNKAESSQQPAATAKAGKLWQLQHLLVLLARSAGGCTLEPASGPAPMP